MSNHFYEELKNLDSNQLISKLKSNIKMLEGFKSPTVDKCDGFTFINRNSKIATKESVKESISYLKYHILILYLRKINQFKVNDDFWYPNCEKRQILDYKDSIDQNLNSIFKESKGKKIEWKIYSDKQSMYFIIHNDKIINGEQRFAMFILIFDSETEVVTIHNLIGSNGKIHLDNRTLIGPFYLSKKDYYIQKVINAGNVKNNKSIPIELIHIISEGISMYKSNHIDKLDELIPQKHSSFELKIFSRLINKDNKSGKYINIDTWMLSNELKEDDNIDDLFSKINDKGVPKFIEDISLEYPIVDFSKKEWKFVNKYIDKKSIMDNEYKYLDLSETLEYPRYGDTLKFIYLYENETYDMISSFIYDKDNKSVRFFIGYHVNENMSIFASIDYYKIQKFNPNQNIRSVETFIYLKNGISLLESTSELSKIIPSLFLNYQDILDMLVSIISIHVVLFDRPERTRMIKETRRCLTTPNQTERKHTTNHQKSELIIKHILLPVKDAKEYINRVSSDNDGEVYREYVMETWERKGYYRRLPNSDKKIYIKPTQCKRHLELVKNKEIHIKL